MAKSNGSPGGDRLLSIDAYRGFTMLAMASSGFGMAALRGDPTWGWLADQFEHRGDRNTSWEGCTFWDLIQPSFMFLVGVSMPFAFAVRQGRGENWGRQFLHAVQRSLLLILIGVFLDSYSANTVVLQFIRVLQQIALGYLVAFLFLHLGPKAQAVAAILILAGHTAAYMIYASVTGRPAWLQPTTVDVVTNVGTYLDGNLLRWGEPFAAWIQSVLGVRWQLFPMSRGHYVTFNALSSSATILFGVLAGGMLRSGLSPIRKTLFLILAGGLGLLVGWALSGGDGGIPVQWTPFVPMIKRLWTASFAIFAAGWTCLMMAAFYFLLEIAPYRFWSFPFMVVGMNSIFMYVAAGILAPVARKCVTIFVAEPYDQPPYKAVVIAVLTVAVLWGLCFWLYRRKIFFKV